MKIRFLPTGGFEKNGAFIEYDGDEPTGQEPEYQRQAHIDIDVACRELEVRTVAKVINQYEKPEDPFKPAQKVICGAGRILPARWGQYTLSLLGQEREHSTVSLSIHSNDISESVAFAGLYSEADLDLGQIDEFFIEINVHESRFQRILSEVSEPGATLNVHVRTHKFGGFYATWSPSISEGRVLKFLDNERDVENADQIPNDFWRSSAERKAALSNLDSPPISISVVRQLHFDKRLLAAGNGTDGIEDAPSEGVEDQLGPLESNIEQKEYWNSAILAQVDAIAILALRVRQAGFLVSGCLVLLTLATLIA